MEFTHQPVFVGPSLHIDSVTKVPLIIRPPGTCGLASNNSPTPKKFDSNNSPSQKINYFKVGEYLEAIWYIQLCLFNL